MNVTLNALRTGVAISACLGLLVACGDRGQFQSRSYSPAELAKYQKALDAEEAAKRKQNQPPVDNGGDVKAPDLGAPDKTPAGPGKTAADANGNVDKTKTPGASGKSIVEVIPSADKFIQDNEAAVAAADDQLAANTFKGITVTVDGNPGAQALAIDAQVKIGNDLRYLNLPFSAINFSKDGTVTSFGGAILKENHQDMAAQVRFHSGYIQILGVCKDDACGEIQLRISLGVAGGPAVAVLIIKPIEGEYHIIDSSPKNIPLFESVQKDFLENVDLPKTVAAKPAGPAKVPTTVINAEEQKSTAKGSKDNVAKTDTAGGTTTAAKPAVLKPAPAATAPAQAAAAPVAAAPAAAPAAAKPAARNEFMKSLLATNNKAALKLPDVNIPASVQAVTQPKPSASAAAAPSSFSDAVQQRKDQANANVIANAMAAKPATSQVANKDDSKANSPSAAQAADAAKQMDDASDAKAKQNADLGFNPDDI